MTAAQRVARAVMIKMAAIDDGEPGRHVAVAAGAGEAAAMGIGMAGNAIAVRQRAESHDPLSAIRVARPRSRRRVTARAGNVAMFPGERVVGLGVIEARCWFPALHVVTGGAVGVERGAMDVAVTGRALLLESDPRRPSPPRGEGGCRAHTERGPVTVRARGVRVTALERPSGLPVVEAQRIPARPADHREFATGVVRVAARAPLATMRRVKPAIALHQPSDFLVTLEAQRRHLLLPAGAMTADATARALERCVLARERAGRDLRHRGSGIDQ